MTAKDIIEKYISFFEKRGHKRIPNASLVPENDPTTLFTSSGMQPLVPYLLGEPHPSGKRLVNVQNSFRAQDIDEIGDNRHTTFFRMLGNWSLGDYFKKEQLPWFFELLTKELGLSPKKLYVTVFEGNKDVPKDSESANIWKEIFESVGLDPKERISYYGVDKNWWSRAGVPENMPANEPGGPDSEVFYDFQTPHDKKFGEKCHPNCNCGRFLEIGNSVFMEYQKQKDGSFKKLPQKNVDFGGGLERLLAAVENKSDMFQTSLFSPIIKAIGQHTDATYKNHSKQIRIIADHFIAGILIASNGVSPSNKEQGYILRRLLRRGFENLHNLGGNNIVPIVESIIDQYKETDPNLVKNFEKVKYTILEEEKAYLETLENAKSFIRKKYGTRVGGELKGVVEISAQDAFQLYSTHGLFPTQIENLGFIFDKQAFAQEMEKHQELSRKGSGQKFKGGLADHSEKTIMGHTATHLMHQAIRDILGNHVYQTGSNITTKRIRFDFNYDKKLTDDEIKKVEDTVNEKINENLKVHFEMMPLKKAKEIGAIGLFDEKYQENVKVYFIGDYSKEFCGGPHVDFTSKLKQFKIIKQDNIGKGQRRLYSIAG